MYHDPRLAVLYDVDNPDGPDHDFARAHATELGARRIVDLGCGTGILTVTVTGPGRTVTGIDPSAVMLQRARTRPGGELVTWLEGTSALLPSESTDLVLMTGNVAMHIIGDDWHATLADIARALVPGGRLFFETRNPEAEAWREWQNPGSQRETPVGLLHESEVTDPPDAHGVVVMHCHNEFLDSPVADDVVDVEQALQFRSREQVTADLAAAGLDVDHVWCDWQRTPFTGGPSQRMMAFDAARR